MAKRATVYDVAKDAGVSIATVSFAFSRPERVKGSTLQQVHESAARLGYVPSGSARGLARGRKGTVGFYAFDYLLEPERSTAQGDPSDPALFPLYVDEVQRGVQLECRRRGLALMLGASTEAPNRAPLVDVAGRVDGLIALAGAIDAHALSMVAERIPVVQLGADPALSVVPTVLVEARAGMAELTGHCIGVHRHRRFVYIGSVGLPEFRDRYEGFRASLLRAGLPVPAPMTSHPGQDDSTVRAVRQVLENGGLPDVLVCSTDQEALVAVDALTRSGVRVPEQVAVVGFDGIFAAGLSEPTITTVRQPMEHIGSRAIALLMDESARTAWRSQTPLPCQVVVGRSCGCQESELQHARPPA